MHNDFVCSMVDMKTYFVVIHFFEFNMTFTELLLYSDSCILLKGQLQM